MKEVLQQLMQKETELTQQLEELRGARITIERVLGPAASQVTIKPTTGENSVITEQAIQRPVTKDPNLNAAFDSIIPVLQASAGTGCTFKQIHNRTQPIRESIKQYKQITILNYLSSLRTNGFIRKSGKKYFINRD
jgi:hypothetical protein